MEIKTSRHPLINTLIHTCLVRKPSSLREVEEFSRHPPDGAADKSHSRSHNRSLEADRC